jgi:CxxC motif-containing protein
MLTSTVRLKGGAIARLPVRSSAPFLKAQMIDAIAELNSVVVSVPISIGDVVLQNVLGTNIDFIATKSED